MLKKYVFFSRKRISKVKNTLLFSVLLNFITKNTIIRPALYKPIIGSAAVRLLLYNGNYSYKKVSYSYKKYLKYVNRSIVQRIP